MRIILLFLLCSINALLAQRIVPIEIEGSDFVVVPFNNFLKAGNQDSGLKFVNTKNGSVRVETFEGDSNIRLLEQVRIDSLQINEIMVLTQKVSVSKGKADLGSTLMLFTADGKLLKKNVFAKTVTSVINNKRTGKLLLVSSELAKGPRENPDVLYLYDLATNTFIELK